MEQKTKINAADNTQELTISREFDLPLEFLFKAFEEAEFVEQWMGTKVIKLDNQNHGSYLFETTDPKGNKHIFHGVIHEFIPNQRITRTFEMGNTPFGVQLEYLEFEKINEERSALKMHVVYKSVATRNAILQLPFAQGINWAHNRLESVMKENRH